MVFGLFGVCWVMLKYVVELLACWPGRFCHHQNGNLWMVAPALFDVVAYGERNNWNFEDTERVMPDFKLFIVRTLLDWMSALHSQPLCSVFDLIDSCV